MRYSGVFKCFNVIGVLFVFTIAQQKIAAAPCPCDIYATGGTPCVAAHSMVRALYQSYNGPLYQVQRASDNTTKDIYPVAPGGVANAASQDSFLTGTTGKVSIIYDQSPNGNNLTRAPAGGAASGPDNLSTATGAAISLNGQKAYGLYMLAGDGYRNDSTKNVATTTKPEGVYEVVNGKHYNNGCCWDYGNAETNNRAGATGLMNCIYFGNESAWGTGAGSGPWIMGDFEAGIWSGGSGTFQKGYANDPSITWNYVTGVLKEQTTGGTPQYELRCGNADSGGLRTIYNGTFVTTWKLQGAIILGIGGDNSKGSAGTWYEGALTNGWPTDTTEDSVQANIRAAGFGVTTTATRPVDNDVLLRTPV